MLVQVFVWCFQKDQIFLTETNFMMISIAVCNISICHQKNHPFKEGRVLAMKVCIVFATLEAILFSQNFLFASGPRERVSPASHTKRSSM